MKNNTILIIEDDQNIANLVALYCEKEGFRAIIASDGKKGLDLAKKGHPSCIILDLMLPEMNGMDVMKQIRTNLNVPIIILTAKEEEIEKILGLEMGADDYVTKPFSPKELIARIKAVMRRTQENSSQSQGQTKIKDLKIDSRKYQARKKEKIVPLSILEFKLLQILASNPGQVFSREQLTNRLHESHTKIIFDRTIDVHIKNLRKKLNDNPKKPIYIESVFGIGYKFKET